MLLRRGRATLFESYEETEQALKKTLLAATAQNSKWPEKFIYKIVPVEASSQRKWVGLTDEEKHDCYLRIDVWSRCVEMVENKLREKNG
jgi:hypothetical protein